MTSPTANEASHLRNGQGAKISNRFTQERMEPLNHSFQNCKHYQNRLKHYREIATQTWPKMNTFMRFAADQKQLVTSFPVEK